MELKPHLKHAIETTYVAYEGLSHPLRVVSTEPVTPSNTARVSVTVEAVHNGEPCRASCAFEAARLDDERHVATSLAQRMREALAAEG